ncbi:MAG: RHS repeat-associated core domain-containing protein [Bacteroidetes bacterium]|nr:RHS repeat-associated core domain-containing protein [Bacteroidota bacterium]
MYHDAYNQLITVDDFWNSATQYRYNASGSRYMRRTGTQAAVYTLRDGSVSVGEYSGSVSTTNWNILLPSGEIVGRQPFSYNTVYYLKDHLGSTRATISSTGAVLESVDYYPFGLEMPGRVTLSGQPTLQRFTGYERVDGERFDYAQARWYDPVIGRFLSVDPLAEHDMQRDKSPYAYSWNNPIRYNDPTGLCPVCGGSFERYVGGLFTYSINRISEKPKKIADNVSQTADIISDVIGSETFDNSLVRTQNSIDIAADVSGVAETSAAIASLSVKALPASGPIFAASSFKSSVSDISADLLPILPSLKSRVFGS